MRRALLPVAFIALLALAPPASAATFPGGDNEDDDAFLTDLPPVIADPWEQSNRGTDAFNEREDAWVLAPVAHGYRDNVPEWGRNRVHDVVDNFGAPARFLDDALQGDAAGAAATAWRFAVNSTVGVLGLFDVGAELGVAGHNNDFGQTLASWGVGSGPYVVLLTAGPSSTRDAVGTVADLALNPLDWLMPIAVPIGVFGASALDTRTRLDPVITDIRRSALDPYSQFRTVWAQHREAELARALAPK